VPLANRYTDDVIMPRMTHAFVLPSPLAPEQPSAA
jgi:hypothetical protein